MLVSLAASFALNAVLAFVIAIWCRSAVTAGSRQRVARFSKSESCSTTGRFRTERPWIADHSIHYVDSLELTSPPPSGIRDLYAGV
eukprot:COSAG05_NODE_23245_length_259_cov_0.650000_1_plen_85_part_11